MCNYYFIPFLFVGICNNDPTDDCRLPNGESDCERMADRWQVNDPNKPECHSVIPSTKAPKVTPSVTTACKASALCELLIKGR